MTARIGLVAAALALAALALWHPAPRPPVQTAATPAFAASSGHRGSRPGRFRAGSRAATIYVAGAVRRPGLYPAAEGERAAGAVASAGGFASGADAAGVNLAEPVADGDEVYVPLTGESARPAYRHGRSHRRTSHRRESLAPPPDLAGVDVNTAGEDELADVPGIGAAIAARIVALRAVDGSFASLDQLLDVAGMTQTRLERARPYLREP